MKISFLCNPVYTYGKVGWKPTDKRLSGTEESVVEWSKELTKRGHQVDIYDNDNRDSYAGGYDICINVKSPDKPPLEKTLYLTNETDATKHDLSMYDGVIWPSQWAVDNIPVNNKTFILPYGYHPISQGQKIRYQCFYASSPDRGLNTLLNVWQDVYKKHPQATLILTYGANVPYLPGVINLGEVDEDTMNDIYRTSDFWCHPLNTDSELFCITGKKAQASGCIPVIIPRAALTETVRSGFVAKDESEYFTALDKALSASDEFINSLRKEVIEKANATTWEQSTDMLLDIIGQVVK